MRKQKQAAPAATQTSATFAVDGKSYELSWDFNSVADAEAEIGNGVNLLHGVSALAMNTASAWQLRGMLYAALKPNHPEMTLRQAGSLIRVDTMPAIDAALCVATGVQPLRAKIAELLAGKQEAAAN